MIRRLIPLVALILSSSAMAQVGIGTKKAASSAQLDVVALKKGVLLPRVELKTSTAFDPIEGERIESLLVYHTGNTELVAGFYYWKSNAWTPLLSGDTYIDRKNYSFTIAGNPTKNGEESLVVTDNQNHSVYLAVAEIANNTTFVTNLVENQEFITKLGDNVEFINHITNNNEFIENIINELKGTYGNVNYDSTNNTFVYYDENGNEHPIDWSRLNTTNVSFTLVNDRLVVTDSEGNAVSVAVEEIANNTTFVTNLTENQEFITKLGDNVEFINHITNNNEFIENIINELKGTYGNVNYDSTNNTFVYYDENGNEHQIDWSRLNTTNVSFELVNDQLVVTDSENNAVRLDVSEIANNTTFVTNLTENQEFITKLGDNVEFINHITNNNEFIENIIKELKGEYGNVTYNSTNNTFVYYDEDGNEHQIDWSKLNTTNVSFELVNDQLVVTDSENNAVRLDVSEIANNTTFVTNLTENQEFITQLGDNVEFIKHITENNEFIENIIKELKGEYGNVTYNSTNNTFVYYDEDGNEHQIDWSKLNTTNVSFELVNDQLVVTDSENNAVRLNVSEIANNTTFVTNLTENQEFITQLGDNVEFIKHITENNEFIENIIKELKGEYGNVTYNSTNNTFVYYDEDGNEHQIDWSKLNTTNVSFELVNDQLVVTDSENNAVRLNVSEIANNTTFVTNLTENQEFITQLGDNVEFIKHITENNEFIENIIKELKGSYGNVNYDSVNNTFVYYDENGDEHPIDWSSLNTTNVSFTLEQDRLVVSDSAGNSVSLAVEEIANNSTFVTNLVDNQEFITKLGDSVEFVKQITENNEFIKNIIKELKDTYGNVGYNTENNTFYYYDENKNIVPISWDALGNTKIATFAVDEATDTLVITDTEGASFSVAINDLGKIIANNDVFVTNLVENQEFITQLGDNVEFIKHITENNEFIENIIKELKGSYGNVNYDSVNNTFVYYDENGDEHPIDWASLNTTNVSFTLENDRLIVSDSAGNSVSLAVEEIANNSTFVTNLVENQEFITKLGDNVEFINHITENNEFIENIIKELKGSYGNVNYDSVNNTFVYYDENGDEHPIDWASLNTTNVSFTLENDRLIVSDSAGNSVSLAVEEIANNSTFVTNLVENQEFITKLGDNVEFINHITENNEFIKNIINELKDTYGNVGYDTVNNNFFYYDENKQPVVISWDALGNTKIATFAVDSATDTLVITDTEGASFSVAINDLGKIIANNDVFVTNLVENQEFITKLGDSVEFTNHLTENNEFIKQIINKLEGEYGNVYYNTTDNKFYYIDGDGDQQPVDWSSINTTNVRFELLNDQLIITDSEDNTVALNVEEIAKNTKFVTELVENQEFITKLGDNIDFINHITENNEFIKNIINELKDTYGNVGYDTVNNNFFYYDENKQPVVISWDALGNTKIATFAVDSATDTLVITDTEGASFSVAINDLGKIIANNDVFVTNLVENQEFITKLGDSVEFTNHLTENNEFIKQIINKLEGEYGNVYYNTTDNKFYYIDGDGDQQPVDWSSINTTNVRFELLNDQLIITDSEDNTVALNLEEIAKNTKFVTELVENQEFITKLGDNIDFINHITENNEFIKNIINELKDTYGNVGYDTVNNNFFYYDENKQPVVISWDALGNTKIATFAVDSATDTLVITDTEGASFSVAINDLGKIIANNDVFVTNLVENQEFITKLGDSVEFTNHLTENNEFIKQIINKLEGEYGNVYYNTTDNKFYYIDGDGDQQPVDWSSINTTNVRFELLNDQLIITDSEDNTVALNVEEIAKNTKFVTELVENQEFITKLGDNIDFINHITENNEFIKNIINELKDTYGNVGYDTVNNNFFYYDENKQPVVISWDALGNTKIATFAVDSATDTLVITDTEGASFSVAINDLGKIIANNDVFVTNLVENQEFITKLGDSNEFKTIIKGNSAIASVKLTDGAVNAEAVKAGFTFNNGKDLTTVEFAETLTAMEKGADAAGFIEYYFVDETGNHDDVVIQVTQDIITDFEKILNDNSVKNLLEQFISSTTGDVSVVRDSIGDIIIKTSNDNFNLTDEIKSKETKTTLKAVKYPVYVYIDGDLEVHEEIKREGEFPSREYEGTKFVYNNEADENVEIKGTDLFGPTGSNNLETVTSLSLEDNYAGLGKALVYENEERSKSPIYITDIFDSSETLTHLDIKLDTRELIYTDEEKNTTIISLNDLVQEPWYTGSDVQATKNDQDIYTMGWVGIGYKTKSTAPNERLRVNGSITATNSYYADYVFENYFDGYSSLKYDYTFNDLSTVDSYIKSNRHLPGITPISELEKTETGYSFNVSELSIQLLEKTEELFLHVIEQKKELDQKADEIQVLKNEVRDLTERLEAIEALLK
ncbi:hypothetical protein [Myroides odoratus]|uniref:DNA polymerase III subunit delta n=1 Tax=Myroides odoratus TaxID=256 RepID=A0A378RNT6_MYROD|nr:hypothetical protein [Myroides odoratus]QQU04538.1 hypothetical protein I6I89_04425 [Myroides odoratus]STZ28029.1 DNA polymerase III subunit delta' [Myroides odoratus]